MTFKDNLIKICKERGTTPTAVVKKLGLSTSKVSAWYNGSLPKADVLMLLAKELNCSPMELFSGYDDLFVPNNDLNDDEKDIIRIYRSLGRKQKHEFMSKVYQYEK